jgi:hypothetical protein
MRLGLIAHRAQSIFSHLLNLSRFSCRFFFRNVPLTVVMRMVVEMEEVTYTPGQCVFKPGETSKEHFYTMVDGELEAKVRGVGAPPLVGVSRGDIYSLVFCHIDIHR